MELFVKFLKQVSAEVQVVLVLGGRRTLPLLSYAGLCVFAAACFHADGCVNGDSQVSRR